QSTICLPGSLKRFCSAIRAACFQLVTVEIFAVTAEVAGSSLVVPAILSKGFIGRGSENCDPHNCGLADVDASGRFAVAGSRTGQTIGHRVVLTTNMGYGEIERPGQFPADPMQGIEPRAAAPVFAPHLPDHYFGI